MYLTILYIHMTLICAAIEQWYFFFLNNNITEQWCMQCLKHVGKTDAFIEMRHFCELIPNTCSHDALHLAI